MILLGLFDTERSGELSCCLCMACLRRSWLCDDHDVERRVDLTPAVAHDLSDGAFYVISNDGAADARADRDADAAPCLPAQRLQNDEVFRVLPRPTSLYAKEFPPLPEPRELREGPAPVSSHPGCFGGIETVSRLRPFARRRFSTLRPAGVAMRARNPCVRFRRRLLG